MKNKKNQEILEMCEALRLKAFAENYEQAISTAENYTDFLHELLSAQIVMQHERTIQNKISAAKFPSLSYLDHLEVDCLPKDLRKRLPELKTLQFIRNGQNVIFTGNSGTGKTHTAIGLGLEACREGYNVLFASLPHLVNELRESVTDRRLLSYERRFQRWDLVILDELGYVSFDRSSADLLFNCLSARAESKSTIITTNLTFERWSEVFVDAALTSALVDRLTYRALNIDMVGESYRLKKTMEMNKETEVADL